MRSSVKRLGSSDISLMTEVNALFCVAFDDDPAYRDAKPTPSYLAITLANSDVVALAAIADNAVVGGLVGYVLPKLEQARSEIYIYDLAVAEAYRRQGVATALINEVRYIAHETGAWVVYIQADLDDPAPDALYSKLGQREEVLHFDLTPCPRPAG